MIEQYKIDDAVRHLRLIRYLLSSADNRGLTHGEKHYLIQTALAEVAKVGDILGDGRFNILGQNATTEIKDAGDIPL